jgi:hypothetical protein
MSTNLPLLEKYNTTTPSMTCAGLLGLAFGYGSLHEATLRAQPEPKPGKSGKPAAIRPMPDPAQDIGIRKGFSLMARIIGQPLDDNRTAGLTAGLCDLYYLLWSVERVAVTYGLTTMGNQDWYSWGAELLLPAQGADGSWRGKFGRDVDTSFALLFLRRANLNRDLTAYLKGHEFVQAALKAARPGNEKTARTQGEEESKNRREKTGKPAAASDAKDADANADRLGTELLKASGRRLDELLDQLKQGKGGAYTEALAGAISRLKGSAKAKAREALAERLARMTPATLRDKLQDEAAEIRRAAALACASKADTELVPDLIPLLEDRQGIVVRAAHVALKDLTRQDFGPAADATPAARQRAAAAWRKWWEKQGSK